MILLAVLAADSVISATSTGRWRPLLLAGLWVGLAFQAKMLEAWLVLPALAGCYLLAAPGGWLQRARRCGAMALLAVAVSLSWMSLVTIWPAGSRPYIDGSTDNSAFQQVFVYNGFGLARPGHARPAGEPDHPARAADLAAAVLAPAADRRTGPRHRLAAGRGDARAASGPARPAPQAAH